METFKNILVQQIDTLQIYFDNCADGDKTSTLKGSFFDYSIAYHIRMMIIHCYCLIIEAENSADLPFDPAEQSVDFKGEAITFKATSEGVLATLQHCLELMTQREDAWRRRWEKEVEKRRKVEELYYKAIKDQFVASREDFPRPRVHIHGGPDYEVRISFVGTQNLLSVLLLNMLRQVLVFFLKLYSFCEFSTPQISDLGGRNIFQG